MIIFAFTAKYGRRINIIITTWISLLTCVLIVSFNNQNTRYLGMFILGACYIRNVSVYILATEISPVRLQMVVATLVLGFDVQTMPISSVYFKFISNDWRPIGYFSVAFAFMNAIMCLFIPESPRFLYEEGEFQKSKEIINKMARLNKSELKDQIWYFDVENETEVDQIKGKLDN
jgi:MFS family permease